MTTQHNTTQHNTTQCVKGLFFVVFFLPILGYSQIGGPGGVGRTDGASDLQLWLKADAISYHGSSVYSDAGVTLAVNGEGAQQWNDNSGYGRNATQGSSGDRPTYLTSSQNGLPSIHFTAANNDRMSISVPGSVFGGDYSVFLVAHGDAAGQDILAGNFTTNHGILFETRASNVLRFLHRAPVGVSGGDDLQAGTTLSHSANQIISATRTPATGVQQFWIDGADNQSLVTNDGGLGGGTLTLGAIDNGGGRQLNGQIAELIVYNKALNTAERWIVQNYLSAKYNIAVSDDIYDQDDVAAGNYDYEVAGVGRVDATNLLDSAAGGAVRIRGLTAGLNDDEFFFWGHDNGVFQANETTDIPPLLIQARLNRVWRVSETNAAGTPVDIGAVDLLFDLTGIGGGPSGNVTASDLRLLIDTDNDGSFSDETVVGGGIISGATGPTGFGNEYEFAGVTGLTDGLRFTLATINTTQTELPVEFTTFEVVEEEKDQALLTWTTATETNNQGFVVERSVAGQPFEAVGYVAGAGNSNEVLDYSFTDQIASVGAGDICYRLRQEDYDGSISHSPVDCINRAGTQAPLIVYPNPSKNGTVTVSLGGKAMYELQVIRPDGVIIYDQLVKGQGVKIADLQPGVYFFKALQGSGDVSVQRVVIQ